MNIIRIDVNGVLSFSEQRVLTEYEQVWAAADITWADDGTQFGTGSVAPFPSPAGTNEVGAIAIRNPSQCGTPTGWVFPGE